MATKRKGGDRQSEATPPPLSAPSPPEPHGHSQRCALWQEFSQIVGASVLYEKNMDKKIVFFYL